MEQVKLKYLCSSYSTPITQDQIQESGNYKVYGASGQVGFLAEPGCKSDYLGIIKDGAGVGRISTYEASSYLLGTMAYIVPNLDVDINWLKYAVMSLNLSESISKTTIPHIYFSEYGNRKVSWCTIEEQHRIAAFLDRKCAEIDSVIADTQRTIEEYKKLKQSVITQAVTKGIRGERPMKDSGIEWIGEIPVEWTFAELKMFCRVNNGKEIANEVDKETEGAISVYGSGGVFKYTDNYMFDGTTVMFGRKGTLGKPLYVTGKVWVVDTMYYLTYSPNLIPKFNYYQLWAFDWVPHITQTALPSIVASQIVACKFAIPSLQEQQEIIDFLDRKCAEIDKLIADKTHLLEELENYKKSVIYEYVTGKKEVPACQ